MSQRSWMRCIPKVRAITSFAACAALRVTIYAQFRPVLLANPVRARDSLGGTLQSHVLKQISDTDRRKPPPGADFGRFDGYLPESFINRIIHNRPQPLKTALDVP